MPLPALAAVAKAAAPLLKKAALKAAKKKAVSTAVNAMRPKEEEQKSMENGGKIKRKKTPITGGAKDPRVIAMKSGERRKELMREAMKRNSDAKAKPDPKSSRMKKFEEDMKKRKSQLNMEKGGKYKAGGRKPGAAQDKVAKVLKNRAANQKFKSEVNKLRADRMSEKASTTKNKVVKALREEVAAKRGDQARGNAAKAERSTKAANFASKRGDMARNRSKNKAAKAEIRAKYAR